ncbi:MAG: hypothetical protein G01um101433_169 [Parcubacteria group bacterium Gr01-1014_33]|nr:MAG: hypothetical protein G01um101433_169 [Parcubacteria group bacterium Gr01-1014_33]
MVRVILQYPLLKSLESVVEIDGGKGFVAKICSHPVLQILDKAL